MVDKISKKSINGVDKKKEKLKSLFPEVFKEGKIDFAKLREVLGDVVGTDDETYSFTWAGKQEAIKNMQTSSYGTLVPDKEESINFDDSDNLFIEGDNLEVLKLLQKSYGGEVKMIFIDPPYNTGNDFIYKDDYKEGINSYLRKIGRVDDEGNKLNTNTETNGRFHSDWLTMMYPRLYMARNLLDEDGVIFITISDKELYNLKKIMDEIFGEDNFIGSFIWQKKRGGGNDSIFMAIEHDYILTYVKDKEKQDRWYGEYNEEYLKRYNKEDEKGKYFWDTLARPGLKNPIEYTVTAPDGTKIKGEWVRGEKRFYKDLKKGEIRFKKLKNKWSVQFKQYLGEGKKPRTLLTDLEVNSEGKKQLAEIFGKEDMFDNPKPFQLIKYLISIATKAKGDIVLDFFAGSCSTAHAVLESNKEDDLNRRFICIQLPEKTSDDSIAFQSGYEYISEVSKERIRRVINGYGNNKPINDGFKVFKLDKSNYKIWEDLELGEVTVKDVEEQLALFENSLVDGYRGLDVIYEVIIKEGYSLNAKIQLLNIENVSIYKVEDDSSYFYITLDKYISEDVVDNLDYDDETLFVCLDTALNDNSKINLSLRLNLKTI